MYYNYLNNKFITMRTIKFILLILLSTMLFLLLACGSMQDELPGANIEKISNSEKNLALDDVTAIGFKKNKTYNQKIK